jgi:hemerythrin-like domain-containing protein
LGSKRRKRVTAELLPDLDLREIPIDGHWPELLRAFDALVPGQSLAIVGVKNCGETLRRLQAQRPAACEWIVLSETERGTRVELRRRVQSKLRSVTDCFESDHQRLNGILRQVVNSLRAGAVPVARETCERFRCGIHKHIDAEETVLFPVIEQAYGLALGAKTVMGAEHNAIRELIDSLGSMLESASTEVCVSAALELSELLVRHDMKEEQILYPMVDQWIGDQRSRHELVSRVLNL